MYMLIYSTQSSSLFCLSWLAWGGQRRSRALPPKGSRQATLADLYKSKTSRIQTPDIPRGGPRFARRPHNLPSLRPNCRRQLSWTSLRTGQAAPNPKEVEEESGADFDLLRRSSAHAPPVHQTQTRLRRSVAPAAFVSTRSGGLVMTPVSAPARAPSV